MARTERYEKISASEIHQIRQHLGDILQSQAYIGSKRCRSLLETLVEDALAGRFEELHERSIGVRLYGRKPDYDTANDAIVRVNATEVRKRLAQYYRELDCEPRLRIELPSGTYIPRFVFKAAEPPVVAAPAEPVVPPAPVFVPAATESVPTETALANAAAEPAVEGSEAHALESGRKRFPWLLAALCLLAVTPLLIWSVWHRHAGPAAVKASEPPSILVLPLENLSGDSSQDFFADGLTDELITDLGQVPGLRTISRTSAMSFKKTPKTLPEIARELQVQWVVEGSVQRDASHVRVTAQLIDAATDHPVWSTSFTRDLSDTLKLQGELAMAIASRIQVEVTPKTRAILDQPRSGNEEAQQAYLQGMVLLQSSTTAFDAELPGNIQLAIRYFQRAAQLDPTFAQPHAALAEAYSRQVEYSALPYARAYPMQKAEAQRAIELNPSLAEGHAELASAVIDLDYGWSTAEAEFKKALELNPGSVGIRLRYALYLIKTGHPTEAVAQVELCRKLDPLSARMVLEAEYIYFFSRKYDEAGELDRNALAKNIVTAENNHLLGQIDLIHGRNQEAIRRLAPSGFPTGMGRLGVAQARAGQTAAAQTTLQTLRKNLDKDGVGAYEMALIYAALGDKDNAFKMLDRGFAMHDKGVTYLKIDPFVEPLRSDPRFGEALKRAGFSR